MAPSEPTALIDAVDLVRDFGLARAVDGVDIRVRRGEVLALLGPNGAGKTSTLGMICGTLAPTRGTIAIAGVDLIERPREAKRALGYLPEQPPLYPEMTVAEFLDFSAALRGLRGDARRHAVHSAIERCALGDVRRRLIAHLSKGFRQRAGIAQAILHDPAVVVLDEPTVGLDPIQIREIRSLIAGLGRDRAVILSTHILPEVQTVCSRVNIMHRGRIVWRGSMGDFDRSGGVEHVTVALTGAAAPPDGLPGAGDCTRVGDGRFRIRLEPGPDSVPALAAALVERGFGLRELVPEKRSLEHVFVEVTASETAHTAGGDAAA